MPVIARHDGPGTWHHVVNRGIARRDIFKTRMDARFFLSRVARSVRDGRIEIHAFSLLSNHFHLLLHSLTGELSQAMRQIESGYARWFNLRYDRDGPLFRTRFKSKAVAFDTYWKRVVRYIDLNAVEAQLVNHPRDYPLGSAYYFCRSGHPPWLARWAIEKIVREELGKERFQANDYPLVFPVAMESQEKELVERRFHSPIEKTAPLDKLLQGANHYARRWLRSRSLCADGSRSNAVLVSPATIRRLIESNARQHAPWKVYPGQRKKNAWRIVEAGLLRMAAGLRFREISLRLRCSEMTATRMVKFHMEFLQDDTLYADRAGLILQHALQKDHPAK